MNKKIEIVRDKFGNKHNLFNLPENAEFSSLSIMFQDLDGFDFPNGFRCDDLFITAVKNLRGDINLGNVNNLYLDRCNHTEFTLNKLSNKAGLRIFRPIALPTVLDISEIENIEFFEVDFNVYANVKQIIISHAHYYGKNIGLPSYYDFATLMLKHSKSEENLSHEQMRVMYKTTPDTSEYTRIKSRILGTDARQK